eukprot:scaffold87666_cov56-Phaeocystis_antarctica.AAC.1
MEVLKVARDGAQTLPDPVRTACAAAALQRALAPTSFLLGRAHTECPTPTSCTSVARGRTPRPPSLLAMESRAGLRAPLYSGGERGMSRIGPSHPERTESS